ncbi:restriction endonuclease subunit S [Clostridium sp. LQ25]|uniref:restriction endonuclease subunit S n=1 Tax=Clostridium sp. LQ25 TaxID=2992805 RepID=UPI00224E71D7|nr:restriction endonuclease subunit S [Clostridium sp. LQ25]UZT06187.1 restriction endonuclease subunit S [Clostridium sp. LQ25]
MFKFIKAEEYFNITIGKTPPRKEKECFSTSSKDVKWISISDLKDCGVFISDSSEYLVKEAIDSYNVKIVPNNTVVLSFKLTIGRVAITDGEMATNEAIAHFRTKNDYIVEYLYCYLKRFKFDNLGSTSSIAKAINSKIIKSMIIMIPDDYLLKEFHEFAKPIMKTIKNKLRENKKLIKLRDTLLPKLMNGEIDVSNISLEE